MCSYRERCICEDSLVKSLWITARENARTPKIFSSADSITIGRIGERHGPEGWRSGAGF